MPMQERFIYLLNQYYNRQSSPEELEEFYLLVDSHQYDDEIRDFMNEVYAQDTLSSAEGSATEYFPPGAELRMLQHVLQSKNDQAEHEIPPFYANVRRLWPRIAAAASIILALSAGGFFLLRRQQSQQVAQIQKLIIQPGSNKAILTLSNGKQINLNDASNGIIAKENNAVVKKAKNGAVSYQPNSSSSTNQLLVYNTISTPKGGQWLLVLPDGTKVMLDAASSIKYPVAFTGNERRVEITGQAYFEVIHNSGKPFRVTVKGQTIEDLGTHFNINAYDDEPVIATTLIEGRIAIAKGAKSIKIVPGQQAITTTGSSSIKVKSADVDEVIAWKNGKFLFDDEQLGSIMRQVSRWYDVDVVYEDEALKNKKFIGVTARFANVSELLNTLEMTNEVKFNIQGRKIIVQHK